MEGIEKLQDEAKRLVEQSIDEEFQEMLFYWHGDEYLAEELRRSIGNCEHIDSLGGFIEKFKKNGGKSMLYLGIV